ncbi:hypothetical protein HKCCE2091_07965 [Rhodobacterales bacterium HKCCE2091]|nr:hypothetical protein [Rhodobacterales bacterium HKCCE2091]
MVPHRPEQLCVRLSDDTRQILEEIKRISGLRSDAEVIRAALGLQHHLALRRAEGRRLYLADADGRVESELLLGGVA